MSWQNEYLAGLKLRDESQRANYELVNACEMKLDPAVLNTH